MRKVVSVNLESRYLAQLDFLKPEHLSRSDLINLGLAYLLNNPDTIVSLCKTVPKPK